MRELESFSLHFFPLSYVEETKFLHAVVIFSHSQTHILILPFTAKVYDILPESLERFPC